MERRWYHEVSAAWLKARRAVLTATDVVALLPAYKRWVKAKDPDLISPEFSAMWAKKHMASEDDTSSYGAAARGHIMEPWAVESWNAQSSQKFYHWDDIVLMSRNYQIGFSPDALNVEHPGELISHAMEIKSYEVSRHMKAVCTGRMDHEELLQIAMAFAVLPRLETMTVLWFCPDAPISMFHEVYTRDDLKDQIDLIHAIADVYKKHVDYWDEKVKEYPMHALCTEQEVYDDFILSQQNNMLILK